MINKPRPWDSGFFGVSVGEFSVSEWTPAAEQLVQDPSAPDLTYVRYRDCDDENLTRLQTFCSVWVKQVTFEKPLTIEVDFAPNVSISETTMMSKEILALAIGAGTHSRFKTDRRLADFYEALYREWLAKSLSGELADKVFVFRDQGQDCGFVTVSAKVSANSSGPAIIGLVSVSPAMRGQGVASRLLRFAEQWAAQQGCESMEIVTQMSNIAAVKFYLKEGYAIVRSEHIFHLWKDEMKHEHTIQ